MPEEED